MADNITIPKIKFTNAAKLSTIPIVDGQFIIVKDTETVYVDMETTRVQINDKDIKNLSVSDGIITMTKHDGTTSTVTINNASQTANGLMSAADKKKSDLFKPISFTVATSGWSAVTASSNGGYGFRAAITNSNITASDSVEVDFNLSCIAVCLTAQVSPSTSSYAGGVYIYAKTKPTATLTGVYLIRKA